MNLAKTGWRDVLSLASIKLQGIVVVSYRDGDNAVVTE